MKTSKGVIVTAFDLEDTEQLGGVKYDYLTVEALDKIRTCMNWMLEDEVIEWQGGLRKTYNKYLDPKVLNYHDRGMWDALYNKQIPTIDAAGFDNPCDQARISTACTNTFNNYAHAAPNEIILFVKYNLAEWQKTWQNSKMFTPMFKTTQNATALEIDQYLAHRAKFIQFTKKR